MEQQNYQYQNNSVFVQEERSVSKKFFANVFLWMFIALAISAFAAYLLATTPALLGTLVGETGLTGLGYVAIFAPVALVFIMGAAMNRLSYGALVGIFILYSILTGVSLAFILLIYALPSVIGCFIGAAAVFATMAVMGYTTSYDLSRFGPILFAAVIGIVIISIVNFFMASEFLSYIIGYLGVAVFTAITAYKVQMIKRFGQGLDEEGNEIGVEDSKKMALLSALSLYITFINLFISLLRIFGSRR